MVISKSWTSGLAKDVRAGKLAVGVAGGAKTLRASVRASRTRLRGRRREHTEGEGGEDGEEGGLHYGQSRVSA
jgi:hypothetical protein